MEPEPRHRLDEDDVGSGEKNPGQQDTEKMISQVNDQRVPPAPDKGGLAKPTGPAQPGEERH